MERSAVNRQPIVVSDLFLIGQPARYGLQRGNSISIIESLCPSRIITRFTAACQCEGSDTTRMVNEQRTCQYGRSMSGEGRA